MRALLGLAAFAAIVPGPPAHSVTSSDVTAPSNGRWVSTWTHNGRDHGHVNIHRGFRAAYGYGGYGGYNDYGDFDGNRSFDPTKWNDWWHDSPERAYPRWMTRNQDCARRWYSGDVLTC